MSERPHVLIDLVDANPSRITIRPAAYLGSFYPRFEDVMRETHAGYSKTLGCFTTSLDRVLEVERRLRSGKFVQMSTAVTPRCAEALFMVANVFRQRAVRALEVVERLKGSGLELYPFQIEGAAVLSVSKAFFLLDEQGLGKTVQALCATDPSRGLLVVAPAAAKYNWLDEARKWRGVIFGEALRGRGSFRWPMPGEIVVINFDILPEAEQFEAPGAFSRAPNVALVIDEIHNAKNTGTKKKPVERTKRVKALAEAVLLGGGTAWGLTGTPMTNKKPKELWTVADLLGLAQKAFGTISRLEDAFREKGAVAEMLRSISLRRERKEVLPELPTKIYRTIKVEELTGEARIAADNAVAEASKAGFDIAKQTDFKWIRAIGGHVMTARRLLAEAKTTALERLVAEYEEEGEPLVVFSAHRFPIDRMATRPGWEAITGDTDSLERQRIVRAFQAGKLKGVACTIDAGGVAITLTRAHVAIFVDREWTPAQNSQGEDRVCRIGQDRGVVIIDLVADHPLDRRIFEILKIKADAIGRTVEASAVKEGQALARDIGIAERYEALAQRVSELPPWKPVPKVAPAPAPAATPPPAGINTAPPHKPRRMAKTAKESWVMRALVTLAEFDKNPEARRIGRGFSRNDFEFGHRLASLIPTGGLTDRQWDAAAVVVARYPEQVGRWEPAADPAFRREKTEIPTYRGGRAW